MRSLRYRQVKGTCPRRCGWSRASGLTQAIWLQGLRSPGPLSPAASLPNSHPPPAIRFFLLRILSPLHLGPTNTQPRPRAGYGDTSQAWRRAGVGRPYPAPRTEPLHHPLWGRGQWENWLPTDSPGEPRGSQWHLAASCGAGPQPGPRVWGAPRLPCTRAPSPSPTAGARTSLLPLPLWGPGRAPSLLGAPGSSPVK